MSSIYSWSETASQNDIADNTVDWREGQMPDTVNNSARAMMARVAQWLADQGGALTTGGTGNAYTLAASSPFAALEDGMIVAFKASLTNTGAATLNANATGSKAIRRTGTTADVDIEAGTIVSGQVYVARYSASANAGAGAWVLLNPLPRSLVTASSTGVIADATASRSKLEVPSDGSNGAFMAFNRTAGPFAAYFGIDTDNKFKVGGWSMGANAFEIYHSGNREIPLNSRTVFYQAAAPTGWTQVTGIANRALRVVDTAGGGTGGNLPFTTVFGRTATDLHQLTINQMPTHNHSGTTGGQSASHTHPFNIGYFNGSLNVGGTKILISPGVSGTEIFNTGFASQDHTHSVIAQGGSSAHSHNIDMRVAYIDVIVCERTS